MYRKKIKFTDFNGNERNEEYSFNLRKDEIAKIAAKYGEGFEASVRKMAMDNDRSKLYSLFEELVAASYGVKTEDGLHFKKSPAIWEDFYDSPAYEALFVELMTTEGAAIEFFKGIMPKDLAADVDKAVAQQSATN